MNWNKINLAASLVLFTLSAGFTVSLFDEPLYMYAIGLTAMLWFAYDLIGEIDRYFGFKDK